jgi:N-acetylglucosamine malate deacetylase 1
VIDQKVESMHQHASQYYDWLAYNGRYQHEIPEGDDERRAWLRNRTEGRLRETADRYRHLLIEHYGEDAGARVEYAEAFEACEYGSPLTDELRQRLFTF